MITAQSIVSQVGVLLDDPDTERYTWTHDYKLAISNAIDFIVTLLSSAFDSTKIQPQLLSELLRNSIVKAIIPSWWVSALGQTRVFDLSTYNIWTLLGVDPQPLYSAAIEEVGLPELYVDSTQSFANRLSVEEWGESTENPFKPGSVYNIHSRGAYMYPGTYFYNAGEEFEITGKYLLFRPASKLSLTEPRIGIWYITEPTKPVNIGDNIEFPMSMQNYIVQKVAQYISFQQGNKQSLFQASTAEINVISAILTKTGQ